MRKGLAGAVAMVCVASTQAQLTIDNTTTVQSLVENVLLGGGVNVTNITFNGVPANFVTEQAASFNGSATTLGITSGMMLATGSVQMAMGPNNSGSMSLGGGLPTSDPDLAILSNPQTVNDAAILEFDFVPAGDSLSFKFVFASDEYLEFVNSVNDIFGFFLSGPGINGTFSNNAINIALIPNTTDPVTINTVNDVVNPAYYVDNGDGFTAPFNTDPQYVQYDGFTVVITASALVSCGETYHIKIAIGDASDTVWDSAVFLEGGSFSSPNAIDLEVVTASADGTLTEGCTDATFTITRPGADDDIDVSVVVGGTATNGTDYTSIPALITIPDGQNSVSFPIEAFEDNVAEGQEEIVLTATFVNACGDTSISTATVPIVEYVPMVLATEDLFLECEDDSVLLIAQLSGGFGNVSPIWDNGTASVFNWVPGMESGTYTITATDECEKSVSAVVNVESGCQIVIPNVFSPNSDGENDRFVIDGILGTSNTVRIYNRWGQIVYEANNYRNQWDGDDVSDGTYYYEVQVDGEPKAFTGHLTILNNKR
ncbi:MAG: choice-of-anchor L domain-containing protein [Flavobacteriales bacterium]|nr:choice-of-anchor L domain-containing protein [Flavobacteriales bacterium]MBK7554926.1 choice-of-anchor L domain-containing protein [Flavobacteriales bacterium]MBK9194709.1 choice-of-anchor L domain-containing protein [Flavobacteriales bacterium]